MKALYTNNNVLNENMFTGFSLDMVYKLYAIKYKYIHCYSKVLGQ